MASTTLAERAIAASGSAVLRSTVYSVPGRLLPPATYGVAAVIRCWASVSIWALVIAAALAGSVHFSESRFAACQASQVLLPTTATALTLPVSSAPRPVPAITRVGTTASMPAGLAGVAASVPPKLGQWRITAYTMLGSRTSRPYTALPSTLDGMSLRASALPMHLNWLSGTSGAPVGTGSKAAAAATCA